MQNTSEIVIATLRLIIHMETANTQYTRDTPSGSKFYFLLNACLFPEEIVRHALFAKLFRELFNLYETSQDQEDEEKAKSFILSCFKHSSCQQNIESTTNMKANGFVTEEHLLKLFYNSTGIEEKNMKLSPKYLKAIDDFIADICTAFTEYGAQYDIFCISVRYLLMPSFPSRNRIIVLNKLKDLLNLLTTEEESESLMTVGNHKNINSNINLSTICKALKRSLSGGLPMKDGSSRDPAELLDTIASLIIKDKYSSSVHSGGFFYLFAVGYLARNLASSSIKCECGLNTMKRRMKGMNEKLLDDIVTVSFLLMKDSDGSKDSLAMIIIDTCLTRNKNSSSEKALYGWKESSYNDDIWDKMIDNLRLQFTTVQQV